MSPEHKRNTTNYCRVPYKIVVQVKFGVSRQKTTHEKQNKLGARMTRSTTRPHAPPPLLNKPTIVVSDTASQDQYNVPRDSLEQSPQRRDTVTVGDVFVFRKTKRGRPQRINVPIPDRIGWGTQPKRPKEGHVTDTSHDPERRTITILPKLPNPLMRAIVQPPYHAAAQRERKGARN